MLQIGCVAREHRGFAMKRAVEDPAHMRPPFAVPRRVRITRLVSVLVMQAMHSDPVGRASLKRHRATDCHGILQPLRRGETPMRELTMVADGNAYVLAEEPHHEKHDDRRPMEGEQRGHGSQMKRGNDGEKYPVEFSRFTLYHLDYFGAVCFLRLRYGNCHDIPAFVQRLAPQMAHGQRERVRVR